MEEFEIHPDDLSLIVDSEVAHRGLVNHHLKSADDLYSIGMKQIITHVFKVEKKMDSENLRKNTAEEKEIDYVLYEANFTDLQIWKPMTKNEHSVKMTLYPNMALRNEKTYKGELFVDVNITATAFMKDKSTRVRTAQKAGIKLCKMPILVKSQLCNTHGLSDEALRQLNEDPSDPGGYFIIKGMEWSIDCVENNAFNQVRIFRTNHMKELYRAEFLSQPGDYYLNSDRFIMRWLNDNQLTLEIQREPFDNLYIPFFVIFRILGWENDRAIFDNVLLGEDALSNSMFGFLKDCFEANYQHLKDTRNKYTKIELLDVFVDEIKHLPKLEYLDLEKHPENKQKLMQDIVDNFDKHILPHIGTTMATRTKKMKFLCQIIREIFQVHLGILHPTDRDSFSNKRLHAMGISYAKAIKTAFNGTIIQQIKKKIGKDFKSTSFFSIDLQQTLTQAIAGNEFEKAITAAITSGSKTKIQMGGNLQRKNRLSSQSIQRKNRLHLLADLRKISAPNTNNSKQSERSNQMRQLHMSGLGYVCIVKTPTSESVGLIKELALTCTVTKAQSSMVIKEMLLKDPDVLLYEAVSFKDRFAKSLNEVYVNGDPIGFCNDALSLVRKYIQIRRQSKDIPPEVSVVWDNAADRAMFYTDAGRLIRPLLIVYNNKRDPEMFSPEDRKKPFIQRLALTKDHVKKLQKGEISIQELIRDQIVEYISSAEQENLYLAANYQILVEERNNELREFTHCDIPHALLGLTANTSPYAQHNEAVRTIYQTSQSAQTCGMPALNWPYRCDKDTFLQYTSEVPLIKTVYNNFVQANGSMCIVAIMCYGGGNQEDGIIINRGAVDRGLFNGCKLTNYKTHLDQKESFAKPDPSTTAGMKADPKYYSKLRDGVITVGSKIEKGDVLIGKIQSMSQTKDKKEFAYKDMSIVYKEDEIGIVHDVIKGQNEDDKEFCKVVIRKPRPVTIGDKFSARSGQKSVCAVQYSDSSMPCTREGVRPDLLLNPHAIPSRMTINQLRETFKSLECAMLGTQSDGTIFRTVDLNNVRESLKKLGMNEYGEHRLFVGETGEFIDSLIFMGPTLYQRLQKFVNDTHYCVSQGPTDAITHQPLNGRASKGGLKIGEMECDVLCTHGVGKFLYDKFSNDSDGFQEYICRCGKSAIVNMNRNTILKCKYCKSDADISLVPTSWSAKTFVQVVEGMNVGIRRIPTPFTYNVDQPEYFQ